MRFVPNRPVSRLVFRLWPNGPTQRREGMRLEVGAVRSEGRSLRTTRPDPTTLVGRLGHRLRRGEPVAVALSWRLTVPRRAFDRISRFSGGLRLGSFFPVLAWDPRRGWVTDPPTRISGESSTTPTSDFDVQVDAPRGFGVLASGTQVGPHRWRARAVRDVGVEVGRFRIAAGTAHAPAPVTVRIGVPGSSSVSPRALLPRAIRFLERLARLYGPYRWQTYTVAVAPDLHDSGIEYPTLIFFGAGSIDRIVLAHETAHQWFYSLVGNDQARDPWLDETLASWAEGRLGTSLPPAPAIYPPSARNHVGAPMSYWDRHENGYFAGVYGQGPRALRSLGPPARVDCALRRYAARQAYAIALPGDLLDELNATIRGAERKLRRFGIRR